MKSELEIASKTILNGGTILYPTDTIFGLGCLFNDENAVEKIKKLKGRTDDKSFIIIVNHFNQLNNLDVKLGQREIELLTTSDRPTTVILKASNKIPTWVQANDGTFAVRLVKNDFCEALIEKVNTPIVSTSANVTGNPTAECLQDIDKPILDGVDYVVNLPNYQCLKGNPSRIIKYVDGNETIIRA